MFRSWYKYGSYLSILDSEAFAYDLSKLLNDIDTNESDVCNLTTNFHEIIVYHDDEIKNDSSKNKSILSNETDEIEKASFSVQHSKSCCETFKVL